MGGDPDHRLITDSDIVGAGRGVLYGIGAERRVRGGGGGVERILAEGRAVAAGAEGAERLCANRDVAGAGSEAAQRRIGAALAIADGDVVVAGGEFLKRALSTCSRADGQVCGHGSLSLV